MNTNSLTNAVKRTLAGVSALVMLASAASCSAAAPSGSSGSANSPQTNNGGDAKQPDAGSDVAQIKQAGNNYTYDSADIEGIPAMTNINQVFTCPGSDKVYLVSYNEEGKISLCQTTKEFKEFNNIDIAIESTEHTESYFNPYFGYDGAIYAIKTVTDFGDKEVPDFNDPDFDYSTFDYEEFYKDAVSTSTLCFIGEDGSIEKEITLSGLEEYQGEEGFSANIGMLLPCKNGKFIAEIYGDQEYYVLIDEEGNIEKELNFGENMWFNSTIFDAEGNICALTWGEKGQVIRVIDAETAELRDDAIELGDELMNVSNICSGFGDYRFLASTTTDLYGIKEDGSTEKLINWTDSDLNGDFIRSVIAVEDGSFIAVMSDYMENKSSIMRLTKADPNASAKEIITIGAAYPDSRLTSIITDFNKANSDYRIKLVDYSKYYEYDEESGKSLNSAESQMKMDVVSGNAPDILVLDPSYVQNLASKGAFVDLYEFLGKDGSISKDDLTSNVIKLGETDGKLYSLAPGFYINTVACKSKFYDKDSWTIKEFIETTKNLPDDMQMFQWSNTKEGAFSYISGYGMDFIDYANGTCSFNSPEFIEMLEFCNTLPEEEEERDWNSMSQEEMEKESEMQMNGVRNEKVFLYDMYISDFQGYVQAKGSQFDGSEMNLIGYPTINGSIARVNAMNSFSILAASEHKDVCWEFIKQFFTEEYQTSQFFYGIPGLKKVYQQKLDDTMNDPYWIDENGKKNTYKNTYMIDGKSVDLPNLTKEERDALEAYIDSVGAGLGIGYNEEVYNIINEEIAAYFKGERSAQETADLIQNRVSILVSEQS